MYADLGRESPAVRRVSGGTRSTSRGDGKSPLPKSARKRPNIVPAAFPFNCWYTMARTRDSNGGSRFARCWMEPIRSISRAMGGSLRKCSMASFFTQQSCLRSGCDSRQKYVRDYQTTTLDWMSWIVVAPGAGRWAVIASQPVDTRPCGFESCQRHSKKLDYRVLLLFRISI